ncbi:MAG: hypothetical protein J6A89_00315 [Clostridia bacterium]|nr:hypothetical protein [Clostridia bacterium]
MNIQSVVILYSAIIYAIIINIIFLLLFSRSIGLWGIFSKVGIPEWKSLIPFYNQIVLLKELQMSPWCILLYVDFLIPIIGFLFGRDVTWAFLIIFVGFLIYKYIIAVRLGDSFKKGIVFSFFLAFFPSVLYPVLGCSKKEEYTKNPIKTVKNK